MSKRTWLLVEDDTPLRMMLSTMITLLWENLEVIAFEDGYKASEWLDKVEAGKAEHPIPELALLDIRMPGPPGHEIAHRLRSIDATADTVVVMMTAYRMDPEERQAVEKMAKPDLFISKPLPAPGELKELLDKVLTSGKSKKQAVEKPAAEREISTAESNTDKAL